MSGTGRLEERVRIGRDGSVTGLTGKVEIGQGITTALAQVVADELDVALERVRIAAVDTAYSPDEGFTAGSRSIEESGQALRHASATLRARLLERAGARLGAPPADLTVSDGMVRGPRGGTVSYWELIDEGLFAAGAEQAPLKAAGARSVIGTSRPRVDLVAKVTGRPAYVQDLVLPGMLHARVVRPPAPGARLVAVDEDALRGLPGIVAVVRDGSFLGLVALREFDAIRALGHARRDVTWETPATLPPSDPRHLTAEPSESAVAIDRRAAAATASRSATAEYTRRFIAHAALGPSCAVAELGADGYTVWTHSQGVYPLRHELAKVLGVARDRVRVIHQEGAGCYGHNGADDAALDAALLARAVPGRPVRVQWMRDDEFAWEPFGTAALVRLRASLDTDGTVLEWAHEMWGYGHGSRPNPSHPDGVASLLAARHLARPLRGATAPRATALTAGALRNAEPGYAFPGVRVTDHHLPHQPLRVSALRSLGGHANVFAIESFMDELAEACGSDPLAYRLRHLDDPRARAVLETAAAQAGWRAGERGDGVTGRGVAYARYKNAAAYFACVAEIRLERDIRVTRVWGAIDAGMAVSPDGVINQAEGGIVQATSWTLKEQVTHDRTQVTSRGWDTYPCITFSETPEVMVTLLDRPDEPPLGAGEAFAGPVSAAIANAIHNASGIRLRDLPFTRERLIAASG